jgi:hypothetical protein
MILVLALAAGGLLFMRGRSTGAGAGEEIRASSMSAPEVVEPSATSTPAAPDATESTPARTPADVPSEAEPAPEHALPTPADAAAEPKPEPEAQPEAQPEPVVLAEDDESETPTEADERRDAAAAEDAAPETIPESDATRDEERTTEAAEESAADASPAAPAGAAPPPAIDLAPEPVVEAGAPEAPAEAPPAEAGVLMLNDRHRVTGEGTAAKPYIVSWDALLALESEYEPKTEGKKQIPEWITALDGKHVSITGFIAFPFIAPSAEECMVMLNQWDGCCIGVPPTPYDAVEVKLAEPIDLQQGVVNYGTITGVFRTDPYLVNGWLIGLYVMDEAKLTNAGGKNAPGF